MVNFLYFNKYIMSEPLAIVVPTSIFILSLFLNNITKGVVYLIFLFIFTMIRLLVLMYNGTSFPDSFSGSFSLFIILFTLVYIITPMIISNSINIGIMFIYIVFVIIDIYSKREYYSTNIANTLTDAITSIISGIISVTILHTYFNNNEFVNMNSCSTPKQQSLKCSVYKNGELVS
jgi:hypothetical protein